MFKSYGTIGKGLEIRKTNAKYERSICNSKKVEGNVQKPVKGHGQGHTFKIDDIIKKVLVIRNTYAKYKSPTSWHKWVVANVKVFKK